MKKTAALSALLMILSGGLARAEELTPAMQKYAQAELDASPYLKSVVTREGTMADTSKFKKNGPYKIALAAQGPTNSWAALFDQEARYHVDQLGKSKVSELLYASADGNADKQVPEVEDLLSQNPDALILVPMGRAALAASVDRAATQGVPVVLCASGVDGDSYVTEIGTNLYDLGARAANWLSDQLNGTGNILVMDGIPGVDTAEIARSGAAAVWKNKPGIKILDEQYGQWSTSEAKKIAEQWIAKYGKTIQGIWSDGGQMSQGIVEAFQESEAPGLHRSPAPTTATVSCVRSRTVTSSSPPGSTRTRWSSCASTPRSRFSMASWCPASSTSVARWRRRKTSTP